MRCFKVIRVLQALALAGLLVTALGAVGCGGNSDDESIAKAEYIKQADAICKETEFRQEALIAKLTQKPPKGKAVQLKLVSQAGLPPLQQQLGELEELPASKTDADKAEAFLDEFAAVLVKVEKDPELMLTSAPFVEAEALAGEFGFKICRGA
jgi:hypothetical protein